MSVFDAMRNRQNWSGEVYVHLPNERRAEYVFKVKRIAWNEIRALRTIAHDGDTLNSAKYGNALSARLKSEIVGVYDPKDLKTPLENWKEIVEMFYESADDVTFPMLGLIYRDALDKDAAKCAESPTS